MPTSNREDLVPTKGETIEYEYIDDETPVGRGGCLWGMLGASGCLLVALLPVAFVIILGVNTLDGVFDGVTSIFDPPPKTYTTLNEVLVLERVQQLSELTTTRFNYAQTITTERELPAMLRPLYGEQITMEAVGHINAGVDLSTLTTEDISITNGVLSVTLPPARLQDCILNTQQTRVIGSSTGFFTSDSDIEEQTRNIAIARIREVALEQGILSEANNTARLAVEQLLSLFVVASTPEGATPLAVNVVTSPVNPEPEEMPETCR